MLPPSGRPSGGVGRRVEEGGPRRKGLCGGEALLLPSSPQFNTSGQDHLPPLADATRTLSHLKELVKDWCLPVSVWEGVATSRWDFLSQQPSYCVPHQDCRRFLQADQISVWKVVSYRFELFSSKIVDSRRSSWQLPGVLVRECVAGGRWRVHFQMV